MSTEKVEKRESPSRRSEAGSTIELEKKLMQIGEQRYTIDARQNGESRFCRIINQTSANRRNRVVIPMCAIQAFCGKLGEITNFLSAYTPCNASEKKSPKDKTKFAFSVSHLTPGGRRYYFDVVDINDTVSVRISYVFIERYVVYIFADGIASLSGVLTEFDQKYPSQTNSDDYPASSRARSFMGGRGRTGGMGSRFGGARGGRFRRGGFGARGRGGQKFYDGAGTSATPRTVDPKRAATLKVLSDPAPAQVVCNAKKFTFEFVEGANTFLRITEIINEMRKSTLHVPLEACGQMQSIIGDMNKRLSAVQKPAPSK